MTGKIISFRFDPYSTVLSIGNEMRLQDPFFSLPRVKSVD